MFRIVLLLFAGIGAGYLLRNWSFVARLERGVSLTVWALLFVFGVTIGSNRELIVNFGRFGWQAAVIACLGIVFKYVYKKTFAQAYKKAAAIIYDNSCNPAGSYFTSS